MNEMIANERIWRNSMSAVTLNNTTTPHPLHSAMYQAIPLSSTGILNWNGFCAENFRCDFAKRSNAYIYDVVFLALALAALASHPTCSSSYKNNYCYCKFYNILSENLTLRLYGMWRSSHFA